MILICQEILNLVMVKHNWNKL